MIKVLIIGLGSIGQRHANALISLGVKNIAAFRSNKGQKDVNSQFCERIRMFQNEQEAFLWNPTHIIISNPTSLHLYFIKKAVEKNVHFLVEKPISNKIEDIKLSRNVALVNGVVGYNLRFHGLFQFIKNLIVTNKFGRVITAQLHVGQYLPNWHPYEDYREAYYAKKDLGGGAIRTLSHEIDLMQYLFGQIKEVFAKVQKLSDLEIDVDDVTNIFAKTEICKQVNVHINFLDPNIIRKGLIYFTQGVLKYDYIKSIVTFIDIDKNQSTIYSHQENINSQYLFQMKDFLSNKKSNHACSFEDGVKVVRIIEKCIQSNDEKRELCLV